MRIQTILVPLDGSCAAEQALEQAGAIAQAMSAVLILLRVTPSVEWVGESIEVAEPFMQIAARHREQARSYLEAMQTRLQHLGVPVEIETIAGPVAEAILGYAKENALDLIVICSRKRSGIRGWFHGEVARRVVRDAPCPTLTVKDESDGWHRTPRSMPVVRHVREATALHHR